jgi:hypothetical protein
MLPDPDDGRWWRAFSGHSLLSRRVPFQGFLGRHAVPWSPSQRVENSPIRPRQKPAVGIEGQLQRTGTEPAYKPLVFIKGSSGLMLMCRCMFSGRGESRHGVLPTTGTITSRANPLEQNVRIYRVVEGCGTCSRTGPDDRDETLARAAGHYAAAESKCSMTSAGYSTFAIMSFSADALGFGRNPMRSPILMTSSLASATSRFTQ